MPLGNTKINYSKLWFRNKFLIVSTKSKVPVNFGYTKLGRRMGTSSICFF